MLRCVRIRWNSERGHIVFVSVASVICIRMKRTNVVQFWIQGIVWEQAVSEAHREQVHFEVEHWNASCLVCRHTHAIVDFHILLDSENATSQQPNKCFIIICASVASHHQLYELRAATQAMVLHANKSGCMQCRRRKSPCTHKIRRALKQWSRECTAYSMRLRRPHNTYFPFREK